MTAMAANTHPLFFGLGWFEELNGGSCGNFMQGGWCGQQCDVLMVGIGSYCWGSYVLAGVNL
jgi:hypothetical protein